MNIKEALPGVKESISLKNYTTFKIGGKAKYFFIAESKEDLIKAVMAGKKLDLPFFVLGRGSNLLAADEGYDGLVINFQFSIFNFQSNFNSKIFKVVVGAGLPLSKLVSVSAEKELTGLEWAAGIPGTVGGAIYGNTGTAKESIRDTAKEVEVLDTENLKIKKFKNKNCKFAYRDSIFKHKKNLVILSAVLDLERGDKEKIKEKIKRFISIRKGKQPLEYPSAGSIFKNPSDFFAGELIEKCNLKGKRVGNVKISEKHANFIVNLGKGRAKDVIKLIELIKKEVKNKFGIKLKEEIQYLGFKI